MLAWQRLWLRVIRIPNLAKLTTPDAPHIDVHEIRSRVVACLRPARPQGYPSLRQSKEWPWLRTVMH